jgi:8-oxo-dGTP pyrophosphatase MutT (NUDIX family)
MKITITGPRSVGKTTVSKNVAERLNLKYFSSDGIGEKHLRAEGGLDKAIKSGTIGKFIKDSTYGLIRDIYKKDNFIFDLSGGAFSSRKFEEASEKVRKTAEKNSLIIGLLPSEDLDESVNFLFEREKKRVHFKEMDKKELLEKVKKDYKKFPPLFKRFCKIIIYTEEKTPEEITQEILSKLGLKKRKILTFVVNDGKLLVLEMTKHPEHAPEGGWFVVTGGVEENESSENAVAREVLEETGLEIEDIIPLNWGSVYEWDYKGVKNICEEINFLSFVIPLVNRTPI